MFSKVRAALDGIDAAAANMSEVERADLWSILSALRGPDEADMRANQKAYTTARLRAITVPNLASVADVDDNDVDDLRRALDDRTGARDRIADIVRERVVHLPSLREYDTNMGVRYPHFERHIIDACEAITRSGTLDYFADAKTATTDTFVKR